MPHVPERIDPNRPGLDPVLAFAPPPSVPMNAKAQPAPAYTLKGEDYYRSLTCTAADPVTVTVPTDAVLGDFPVAGLLQIAQLGGTVTIAAAAGVTLSAFPGAATPVRIGAAGYAVLQKTAANTWYVFGDLVKV